MSHGGRACTVSKSVFRLGTYIHARHLPTVNYTTVTDLLRSTLALINSDSSKRDDKLPKEAMGGGGGGGLLLIQYALVADCDIACLP